MNQVKILNQVNEYLRAKNENVKQVTANFLGEQKSIEIIRSGGETLTDVRPLIRFNVSVMLEKMAEEKQEFMVLVAANLMTSYLKMITGKRFVKKHSELHL